jgi:hypothetical protein
MTSLKTILCNYGISLKDVREYLIQVKGDSQTDVTKY